MNFAYNFPVLAAFGVLFFLWECWLLCHAKTFVLFLFVDLRHVDSEKEFCGFSSYEEAGKKANQLFQICVIEYSYFVWTILCGFNALLYWPLYVTGFGLMALNYVKPRTTDNVRIKTVLKIAYVDAVLSMFLISFPFWAGEIWP